MRLVSLLALLAVFLNPPSTPPFGPQKGVPQRADSKTAPDQPTDQPDISRSGTDFMNVCASVGAGLAPPASSEAGSNPGHSSNDAACLGWAEGFRDGFTVHDELLGVPQKDRMVCIPRGVTAMQTIRVIKKYIADNPAKAHRLTRYNASVALARAFPCKAGK
ncbi:MAG TPA: Rap1a/Tai family immunity protein [Candidatus Acidoferrum sp.]|nr:Rap1a/Tai family immunity protein [Candidatus Acidoferrum sp.]